MGVDFESLVDEIEIVEPTKPKLPEIKGKRQKVSVYLRFLPNRVDTFEAPIEAIQKKYDLMKPIVSEGSVVRTSTGYRLIHDFEETRIGKVSHVADLLKGERNVFEVSTQSGIPRVTPTIPVTFSGSVKKQADGFYGVLEFHFRGTMAPVLVEIIYD